MSKYFAAEKEEGIIIYDYNPRMVNYENGDPIVIRKVNNVKQYDKFFFQSF